MQQMLQESVRCCSGDKLMCSENGIGNLVLLISEYDLVFIA